MTTEVMVVLCAAALLLAQVTIWRVLRQVINASAIDTRDCMRDHYRALDAEVRGCHENTRQHQTVAAGVVASEIADMLPKRRTRKPKPETNQ